MANVGRWGRWCRSFILQAAEPKAGAASALIHPVTLFRGAESPCMRTCSSDACASEAEADQTWMAREESEVVSRESV